MAADFQRLLAAIQALGLEVRFADRKTGDIHCVVPRLEAK